MRTLTRKMRLETHHKKYDVATMELDYGVEGRGQWVPGPLADSDSDSGAGDLPTSTSTFSLTTPVNWATKRENCCAQAQTIYTTGVETVHSELMEAAGGDEVGPGAGGCLTTTLFSGL